MKTIRSLFVSASLCAMMCVGVVGCGAGGGDPEPPENPTAPPTADQVDMNESNNAQADTIE